MVSKSGKQATGVEKRSKKVAGIEKTAIKKLKNEVKSVKKKAKETNKIVDKKENGNGKEVVVAENKSILAKTSNKTPAIVVKNDVAIVNNKKNENNSIKSDKANKLGVLNGNIAYATGKRKRSVAKVCCKYKDGINLEINVNSIDYKRFFTKLMNQKTVYSPFALLSVNTGYIVKAEVFGGGKSGQADALKLGISKCLTMLSEEYGKILRKNSFLTRDARIVEPKKYGLKKARKKEQFSKR